MEYTEEELKKIYDNAQNNINTFKELNEIINPLNLVLKNMVYDNKIVNEIIKMLFYFHKTGNLYKINEITVNLAKKVCYGKKVEKIDKSNVDYYYMIIKNLLLPYSINYCNEESRLPIFFSNFDLLWKLILDNCNVRNLEAINDYNPHLLEIVNVYTKCLDEYKHSELFNNSNTLTHLMMDMTLTHMATIFYLTIDKYDYNYEILYETYLRIYNNFYDYLIACKNIDFDKHSFSLDEEYEEIISDYKFCEELLKQTFNPPVVIKKYKR